MQDKSSVEEQYGGSEMLSILIPPSDSLQLLNGAIEPFGFTIVSPSSESIEDTCGMACKHVEYFACLWYMCLCGFDEPHGVERKSPFPVSCANNIPEVLLDSPCSRHLIVGLTDGIELHLLLVRETGRVFEEEILSVLQLILCLHLPNPRLVNGLVQMLDEMVGIVANLRIGEQLLGDVDESLPHIHGNRLDGSTLDRSQVLLYQLPGILLCTAFCDVYHKAGVTIAENSHILTLAPCLLVNAQMAVYPNLAPDAQPNSTLRSMTWRTWSGVSRKRRDVLTWLFVWSKVSIVFFRAVRSCALRHPPKALLHWHISRPAVCSGGYVP